MKSILELAEASAARLPEKIVFADAESSVTYGELVKRARAIGSRIAELGIRNRPVAVLLPRSVENLIAMAGVLYSGNFYTVVDSEMPAERIKLIFGTLSPAALLTNERCSGTAEQLGVSDIIYYGEAVNTQINEPLLSEIRSDMVDTDPAYALFTSGSTGVPKGAVVNHRSVITYSEWFNNQFGIDENTVFGSQTPFYFSMSVSDVFGTLRAGATLHIIGRALFSFPMKLLEFMNERRVNTVYWVPSALCIIANLKVLDYGKPEYLKKVLFAGEVMPVKQLNYWIQKLPDILYANLFGPTETTDICTYYIVDRAFQNGDSLPIGRHCDNCSVFVVKADGAEASDGEEGELYARGSFLAMGYYNNPEKTREAFVQNPLNSAYPETVYKTGDLVRYNERGELIYITRKDFQIKRRGYRIELGEIETAAGAVSEVTACVAVYDGAEDKIILIFEARKTEPEQLSSELKARIPAYMMPDLFIKTKAVPHNQNGKLDRAWLKKNYKTLK